VSARVLRVRGPHGRAPQGTGGHSAGGGASVAASKSFGRQIAGIKFNYLGDVHLVSGVVKEVDRVASTVTIALRAENQRGETPTCDGRAVVLLPPPGGRVGRVTTLPDFRP
jgi:hypothetical protein